MVWNGRFPCDAWMNGNIHIGVWYGSKWWETELLEEVVHVRRDK
jgi:hypothetical protein